MKFEKSSHTVCTPPFEKISKNIVILVFQVIYVCTIFPFLEYYGRAGRKNGHALMSLQPQEGVSISLTAAHTKKDLLKHKKTMVCGAIWHFVCTHPQMYEFLFLYNFVTNSKWVTEVWPWKHGPIRDVSGCFHAVFLVSLKYDF